MIKVIFLVCYLVSGVVGNIYNVSKSSVSIVTQWDIFVNLYGLFFIEGLIFYAMILTGYLIVLCHSRCKKNTDPSTSIGQIKYRYAHMKVYIRSILYSFCPFFYE